MRWDLAQILFGQTIHRTAEVAVQTVGNLLRVWNLACFGFLGTERKETLLYG
jgi:hypothetical protein